MSNALNTLDAATLALLGKMVADAAKANRENLVEGEHTVNETVLVEANGSVKVGADYEQRIVAKAKPWDLLTAALELANEQLAAAGVAGIDMEKVVDAAQLIDPKAVKAAKAQADSEVAGRKAPTLTQCKGKVTIAKTSSVEVVAAEAELAEVA
tara:strand:+ start:536 stop:997 length:462 start_codon:yes stop_codon:yes gene_type:complete